MEDYENEDVEVVFENLKLYQQVTRRQAFARTLVELDLTTHYDPEQWDGHKVQA
jgi:hypothetical protein